MIDNLFKIYFWADFYICKLYLMLIYMRFKMIAGLMLLAFLRLSCAASFSRIRTCDQQRCDFVLFYEQKFVLSIPNPYLINNRYFVFCARARPVINSTDMSCQLTGYTQPYSCFDVATSVAHNNIISLTLNNFTAEPALTKSNITATTSLPQSITLRGDLATNIQVSAALPLLPNSIYEVVLGTRKDLMNAGDTKTGYFHTFLNPGSNYSQEQNMFMQRHVVCTLYYRQTHYIFNLVFYGGVKRQGTDTMFFDFLSYIGDKSGPATNQTLNMWAGLGYSTSHSSRDMISISSGSYQILDLYSLYYGAPFLDTDTRINGTSDIKNKISSYDATMGYSFFIRSGGSRSYDTGDTKADQIIRKKIDYKFCFVMKVASSSLDYIQATNKNYKHDIHSCWTPNIEIWQHNLTLSVVVLVTFMLALLI